MVLNAVKEDAEQPGAAIGAGFERSKDFHACRYASWTASSARVRSAVMR